jgi:hypothetical protein
MISCCFRWDRLLKPSLALKIITLVLLAFTSVVSWFREISAAEYTHRSSGFRYLLRNSFCSLALDWFTDSGCGNFLRSVGNTVSQKRLQNSRFYLLAYFKSIIFTCLDRSLSVYVLFFFHDWTQSYPTPSYVLPPLVTIPLKPIASIAFRWVFCWRPVNPLKTKPMSFI